MLAQAIDGSLKTEICMAELTVYVCFVYKIWKIHLAAGCTSVALMQSGWISAFSL